MKPQKMVFHVDKVFFLHTFSFFHFSKKND